MKTIVLHVPDEADEARVLAALRELQQRVSFYLASESAPLPGPAGSPAELEQRLKAADDSADVSCEAARKRFAA